MLVLLCYVVEIYVSDGVIVSVGEVQIEVFRSI